MRDMENLLRRLAEAGVEFVIVGGYAGVAHGATRLTQDLDVCAPLTRENLDRILVALAGLDPRFRVAGRPKLPDRAEALQGYKHLYLETSLGELDILSEITGLGGYQSVKDRRIEVTLWGLAVSILELDALIEAKRALARPKDLEVVRELELIRAKGR